MIGIRVSSASRARAGKARQSRAQPPPGTDLVVERDDGLFQIGLEDDPAGPFPGRTFAAVAAQTRRGQNGVPTT
jgi:hypothetical protein